MELILDCTVLCERIFVGRKEVSEKTLVRRCLSGDESAWRDLYARYHTHPYVRMIIASPSWGFSKNTQEDLMQEVFIRLLKALAAFRFESSLATFIAKIAKNVCVSELRRQSAKKRETNLLPLPESGDIPDKRTNSPEHSASMALEMAYIEQALEKLDRRCKHLIRHFYFTEKSYREISKITDISVSNVGVSLGRCVRKLRRAYLDIIGEAHERV